MDKSKRTPSDRRGAQRKPTDPPRKRKEQSRRGWNPADDLFGEKVVDKDFDLDGGKYSTPKPHHG